MNICIIGAGAWGTAIAVCLQKAGHTVTLVPHLLEEAMALTRDRENRQFLPGVALPTSLQIGFEMAPALMEAELVLVACPSKFLRPTARQIKASLSSAWNIRAFVILCKGLEADTNLLPCAVLKEELPGFNLGALSGPTFANEIGAGLPGALVFGTDGGERLALDVRNALSCASLRVYSSDDLVGVELGGCLKNVYAIAAGICDGLKLGHTAKAALITRAMRELMRVGTACGGQAETFLGLSGFGDLMLTCTGPQSRNRTFGERVGAGEKPADILASGMTVEGFGSSDCFIDICKAKGIDAPILEQVHAILYKGVNPRDALLALMLREPKPELAH